MVGLFITFEGGEGSGKTTQIKLLQEYFQKQGRKCLLTREPGGNPGAEAIRQLLLTGAGDKWTPVSETLLFLAARTDHVEKIIKPALTKGEIVLCDRFTDSTVVYQGIGKGLGVEYIQKLSQLAIGDFAPDLTLILDIDSKVGLSRAEKRAGDETRFENMNLEFHQKVREGFVSLSKRAPQRYKIIDANKPVSDVHKAILDSLLSLAVLK
jgi:dTMP kinase